MAELRRLKSNFTAGEFSPRVHGRLDLAEYFNGADTIRDFIVLPHGGITRRPGFRFIEEVKTSSSKHRLIPFIFSTDISYQILFGPQYARFFVNGAQLEDGGTPVEISTPYSESDLEDLMWTQSADVLFLAHPDHAPRELRRLTATSFDLVEYDFRDGPYQEINDTLTQLKLDDGTGRAVISVLLDDLDISANVTDPRCVRFNSSGSRMYVLDTDDNTIHQFNLSTDFDLSSATHDSSLVVDTGALGFFLGNSGDDLFVAASNQSNNGTISEWSLTTTDEISTGSLTQTLDVHASDGIFASDVYFKTAGSDAGEIMMVLEGTDDASTKITEFALTTAWDISTATSQNVEDGFDFGVSFEFDSTGENVHLVNKREVKRYELSNNWTMAGSLGSTASIEIPDDDDVTGVTFNDLDGTLGSTLTVVGRENDNAYSYNLNTTEDITTFGHKSVDMFASSTEGINGGDGFQTTDVGQLYRLNIRDGGGWTWVEIVSRSSNQVVRVDIRGDDPQNNTQTFDWRAGEWSDTRSFPSVTTFHDGRLWWGNTNEKPMTLWASLPEDIDNFRPSSVSDGTVTADDAISITLLASELNAIHWMRTVQKGMLAGTSGGEWAISPVSDQSGLSATNIQALRQSDYGSMKSVPNIGIAGQTLFATRTEKEIRTSEFRLEVDRFEATSFSILFEHLLREGIGRMAFQRIPEPVLWVQVEDGSLVGITYLPEENVIAAHRHDPGTVEDISVIPNDDVDELWAVIKRTIDGSTKRYVERMDQLFVDQDVEDAFFVDSGLTGDFGSEQTTVSGLDHLEGETVQVLGDGAPQPDKVVSGGSITLEEAASKVQVGLAQKPLFQFLPFDLDEDTTLHKRKRVVEIGIRFLRSFGVRLGVESGEENFIVFRSSEDAMDSSPPLFSGVKRQSMGGRHLRQVQPVVDSIQPTPVHILSLSIVYELQ